MKKWIAFLLVLVLAFTITGCKNEDKNEETVTPKTIEILGYDKQDIEVGSTLKLSAKITPDNADQTVTWKSKDETKATVDDTGLVTAIAAGVVDITATSTVKKRLSKTITISIREPYKDPESVQITSTTMEVFKGFSTVLKATVLPEGASQEVMWSSSDENVATVDTNGKVTGIELGEVTITVKVVANPSISTTWNMKVVEFDTSAPDKPTHIIVTGANEIEVGTTISLLHQVYPEGISQNVVWSSLNEDIAAVNSLGQVTGLKEGLAYIKVASAKDLTVKATYSIKVIPAKPVEPDPDMKGYVLKIMGAAQALNEHDPFLENYLGIDKTAKQKAWREVEDRFNVKMEVVAYPDSAPWGPTRISWLISLAEQGNTYVDVYVSTTDWKKQLADGGAAIDVTDFYKAYGKNSIGPAEVAAATYKGALYALPSNSYGSIRPYHGLFYNVNLLKSKGLESPAKLFNQGKWTFTGFKEYVLAAAAILGDNESVLSGKPAAFYYGMTSAAGVKLIDTQAMQVNFNNTYAYQAAKLLQDIYNRERVWGDNAWDAQNLSFNEGRSLFQAAEYWFVDTDNRFPKDMWGDNTQYGYVPFPYPDNMTKDDTRVSYQGGACYMLAPARSDMPTGVTLKDVYRAFTTMMLLTVENMKADPELTEELLMKRAAESKLDDEESVNAIIWFKSDKVIFDPFFSVIESWRTGGYIDSIVRDGKDYFEIMDSIKDQFVTAMNQLYA